MSSSTMPGDVAREIQGLSRDQCIHRLTHFPKMRLDFTDDYLRQMSLERLRHVLMAAYLTTWRKR